MKSKIFIVFILVAFACLPLKALAYERNFPAGSIIIPMDAFYQPDADGGLLESYGLAYYLLDHQDPQCLTDAPTEPVVVVCVDNCPDGDTACELACVEAIQEECEHTIAISWVINDQKTDIGGVDLRIDVTAETLTAMGISAVVKEYDHAGGTTDLTFNPNEDPVDSAQGITYHGSIFIIDVQDLEEGVEDEAKGKAGYVMRGESYRVTIRRDTEVDPGALRPPLVVRSADLEVPGKVRQVKTVKFSAGKIGKDIAIEFRLTPELEGLIPSSFDSFEVVSLVDFVLERPVKSKSVEVDAKKGTLVAYFDWWEIIQ